MKKVVLLRHGESEWNKENRFTSYYLGDPDAAKRAAQTVADQLKPKT